MKPCYLYIIMSIFSLLALPGCREEEAVQTSEGTRTVTVNLGIAMSRVTEGSSIGDGSTPKDMKVWIFDQNNSLVDYYEIDNPTFSGSDALGELVNTHEHVFELDNTVTTLNFYAVLNSESGTGLSLTESSSVTGIQNATFTGLQNVTGDNQVPIYGTATVNVSDHKNTYPVTIETKRAVSKLELFFTKESEKSQLTINGMTLTNIPSQGFLAREATTNDAITYSDTETALFTGSQNIDNYLPEETSLGDFSTQAERFNTITLSQPYLLENPYNTAWSNNGNTDYYEFPQPEEADEKAYVLTVAYTLNNKEEECSFVLPETKRNIWNKIFVRVNDNGELIIQYKALPWQLVKSNIGYAPQHVSTSSNPFANETSYNEFINGNNYVLFPIVSYNNDRSNTQKLFNYIYQHPEEGDNEARLCILTRPTYDNDIDNEEHWALKAGSAGARYMFMLTGPEGATWEAHLTNKEDFSFSTTDENDFKGSEYESDGKVNKVTHGIARQKPYIIQIIANHLYTGFSKNMSGETDAGSDFGENGNDGYDQYKGYSKTEWEALFEDDYLTDWGEEKWNKEEVVETDFYITVKLTDGSKYNLIINPSFEKSDIDSKKFPFLDKRRFAGNDTHIWIRHLRAQYGWQNLEYLARDVDPNASDNEEEWDNFQWWMVNKYWNPNHEWSK